MNNHLQKLSLLNPIHFLGLGFGTGLMPKAPGTFGTLAALPIYWLMSDLSHLYYLLLTALLTVIGFYICHKTAQDMGEHDHPAIVWDEICGYLITMFMAPQGLLWALLGFALFRFFDITKLGPIGWSDKKLHGGFGIMMDDVIAGVAAALCLQAIALFV